MAWFSKLKEQFTKQKELTFYPSGPPDPKFLGDSVVFHIVNYRFGLQDEQLNEIVSELPGEVRDLTRLWILLYLCWLFKLYTESKYGKEFIEELQKQIKHRFQKVESIGEGMAGIGQSFQFWMERLDIASSSIGIKVEGVEVPFEITAAITFLTLDASSPFYQGRDFGGLEYDIGYALASAKKQTVELIQSWVDLGAPIQDMSD